MSVIQEIKQKFQWKVQRKSSRWQKEKGKDKRQGENDLELLKTTAIFVRGLAKHKERESLDRLGAEEKVCLLAKLCINRKNKPDLQQTMEISYLVTSENNCFHVVMLFPRSASVNSWRVSAFHSGKSQTLSPDIGFNDALIRIVFL